MSVRESTRPNKEITAAIHKILGVICATGSKSRFKKSRCVNVALLCFRKLASVSCQATDAGQLTQGFARSCNFDPEKA